MKKTTEKRVAAGKSRIPSRSPKIQEDLIGEIREEEELLLKRTGTGKKAAAISAAVIAFVALIIYLNSAFFHFDFIPSWSDVYRFAGLSELSGDLTAEGEISVHYIDVGQGDCALVKADGTNVLIDSGEYTAAEDVIAYLSDLGIDRLDMVIASHPHSDHIGSMNKVIDKFGVDVVVMPKLTAEMIPTTSSYEKLLRSIKKCGGKIEYAKVGNVYEFAEGCELEIIAPVKDYDDLNNYSIVARLRHGNKSFLFTGDIEKSAERDILDSGADISADVLKIAHHGSHTSSLKAFLQAVAPEYAVISVGSPNDYGHPHKETTKLLNNLGITVYRTDRSGSITFISDGENLRIETQKETA